jgi:hypothetical protein
VGLPGAADVTDRSCSLDVKFGIISLVSVLRSQRGAKARLDHARKYGPKNQGGDGCCNYPTISASTHNISLVMQPRVFSAKS